VSTWELTDLTGFSILEAQMNEERMNEGFLLNFQ